MAHRRILSLWFPKLAAEQVLRQRRDTLPAPFAVIADQNGAKVLKSLNDLAEAAGLRAGQPLRDAQAMCPALMIRAENLAAEAGFLAHLRRWAGQFSPWVAPEGADSLVIDLTGCAHLFGGEAALLAQISADCADLGLTVRAAIADTRGGAWALARYAGQVSAAYRNGDSIAQEARATRSRAAKRRGWERLAAGAQIAPDQAVIAPVGMLREVLAPLPLAALRLDAAAVDGLQRLGLRCVRDVLALPRAPFARRFGAPALRRLDQALGVEPEPIAPMRADAHFATRLSFPDPIGLRGDIEAGLDRLLPRLCDALRAKLMGVRMLRLQAFRADGGASMVEIGLARAANTVDAIRPLLWLKLDQIDVGFGVDCLRLHAFVVEPLTPVQHAGHLIASARAVGGQDTAVADLIGKLGARLGSEAVVRLLPSASHIPAKATQIFAAAWCDPDLPEWQAPPNLRPMMIFPPEAVTAPNDPTPPATFRWRRRDFTTRVAIGSERILPEWWFDDPEWRSGPRDYWRVETQEGERLWLFHCPNDPMSAGWFCEGGFD